MVSDEKSTIDGILARFPRDQAYLLPMLHDVHHAFGYLSQSSVEAVAQHANMTPAAVYGVGSFYSEFRTKPPGKLVVKFCQGPACYLRGLHKLERVAEAVLGLKVGETGSDGLFSLERVHCNGTCDVAPVMFVNESVYGNLKPADVARILSELKRSERP